MLSLARLHMTKNVSPNMPDIVSCRTERLETPSRMQKPNAARKRRKCYDETVWPPQSGIVTPFFRLRSMSMRPHLSSHSLPGSL